MAFVDIFLHAVELYDIFGYTVVIHAIVSSQADYNKTVLII